MPVTGNVFLQLHRTMHVYLPEEGGRWKATDNEIVERDSSGAIARVRFRPVAAVATPQAVGDLARDYDDALRANREALLVVPLFVLDFLCIHPFQNGNGRVSRLVALLLLYHAGYDVGRYISLERIVQESRDSYYETLETSSQGWHDARHDAMPWVEYFWGVLLNASRQVTEMTVGTSVTGYAIVANPE